MASILVLVSLPAAGGVVPPNCASSVDTFLSTDTPIAIPDGPGGIAASTITVSGVNTYLQDLDLFTDIPHTFAADLHITVTSPAGTAVTLTTDNGGTNDNVFAGTTWDDDAGDTNPPGPVTDNTFANAVVETPLVPEEAFAAFIGEDPNGTWTLDIVDDAGQDIGTLNSWSVTLTTLTATPIFDPVMSVASTDTPSAIPDGPGGMVSSTIAVSGGATFVCDVDITTDITHTFATDLDLTVTSPGGTVSTMTTDNGGVNDNVFAGTLWDDDAGDTNPPGPVTDNTFADLVVETPLVFEEALGAFIGEDPNGNWVIDVIDDTSLDLGTLNSWTVHVTTCACVAAADLAIAKTGSAAGTEITWTIEVTNNGPVDATGVVVTDPLAACTTFVSDDCGGANVPPWTWNIGSLLNGATVTCNVVVDSSGCLPGPVSNTADVNGVEPDPDPANNSATTNTQLPVADLEVTKSGSAAANQITWTTTVTNNGPDNATGVVVTDPLDPCTTYVSDDCGGSDVPPWTWNVGALLAGASAACNLVVDASGCGFGVVSNTATGAGNENDPDTANNAGTAGVGVGSVLEIPTLGRAVLLLLALLVAAAAVWKLRGGL